MIANNLAYRPVRTGLSVLAVAIEVILIISVVGLVHGLIGEMTERQKGIGADIIVQPTGASVLIGLGSTALPVKLADKLQEVEGVAAVTPALIQNFGGLTLAWGIDVPSFTAVTGGLQVLEGRIFQPGSYEAVVDDIYAADNKLKAGDKREFWDHSFEIVGIAAHGKGARVFVPLKTMQDLYGSQGKATVFYVKLTGPERVKPVLDEFKAMLPGYPIYAMTEFTSLMMEGSIPGVNAFQAIMIGIAVVIGFLVIFLAMYTTVLERTREIGTLKALGASKRYIVDLILRETGLVAVAGIIIGIVAALALRYFVLKAHPTLSIEITARWLIAAALIAIGGAILGAFYPAFRAARQDPIEALAYE
jgi:putative ABC transport system permease protein